MRFQSPLSNLCEVLIQMRVSAKQYQGTLTINEAATRAVLIDPILRALGWDIANTSMVEVERTLGKFRADYTLYDSNATAKAIVEAKSLGTDLAHFNTVNQLPQYAFSFQVGDIFLTDGLKWHHYDKFQPTNFKPTQILDILNDEPVFCAAYMVQKLDAARYWSIEPTIDIVSQRIDQLENTISNLQKILANTQSSLPSQILQSSPPTITNSNTTISQTNLTYIELSKLNDVTGKRPSHLQLPDGITLPVKKWKDILRECCKFALSNNSAIILPLPDRSGKKVSLFSTIQPAAGISYITEQYNNQTVYIYLNYDANNCVANSVYVLKQLPAHLHKFNAAVVIET